MMKNYDLVIIGAGPAGLGCAISAIKRKKNILLIDKGNVVNSIINFPTNMIFFSTSDVLELHDIPFNSMEIRPNRVEAVKYYQSLVRHFNIPLETGAMVESVTKKDGEFTILYLKRENRYHISSKAVILATGFYDNPNLLGIKGEDLDHVSHYYKEAYQHYNQDVVVVGGKNSAVEAALDLHRHGARVTLVHRKSEIRDSVKYWVIPDIMNRINEGSIKISFNTTLTEILPDHVRVRDEKGQKELKADAVYLLIGYHPDTNLLKSSGIQFDSETLESAIDQTTSESNVKGLFLAGSLVAGRNANKIFIENSRKHGEKILTYLGAD